MRGVSVLWCEYEINYFVIKINFMKNKIIIRAFLLRAYYRNKFFNIYKVKILYYEVIMKNKNENGKWEIS